MMKKRPARWTLMVAATAFASLSPPTATNVAAQRWDGPSACFGLEGRDRWRCERKQDRHEKERRKDARRDGIVAGAIGAAVIGGAAIAIASSSKKKSRERERRRYCIDRYGSYDASTDSYRAADGRWYRCE